MNYEELYSGEHLKKVDPHWSFKKWSYRHTFVSKMKYIMCLLERAPKNVKILDAGCGQGLLVEHSKKLGLDITGIDAFYGSENVIKANILESKLDENSFDLILCLDVIEHFQLDDQAKLIAELTRICKPGGRIIWSIPNLANLSSRIMFFFTGYFLRTANAKTYLTSTKQRSKEEMQIYHPGDRPIKEYYNLLSRYVRVVKKKGLSPTVPVLFQLTQLWPQYTRWLHELLSIFNVFPNWGFNVIVITKKE